MFNINISMNSSLNMQDIERTIQDRIRSIFGYDVHFAYSYSGSYHKYTSVTVRVLFKVSDVTFLFIKKKHQFKLTDDDQYDVMTIYTLEHHVLNEIENTNNNRYRVKWIDKNDVTHETLFMAKNDDDLKSKLFFGHNQIDVIQQTLVDEH